MPAQRVGQASRRPGTREAADDPLCPQVPHLEIQSLAEEGRPPCMAIPEAGCSCTGCPELGGHCVLTLQTLLGRVGAGAVPFWVLLVLPARSQAPSPPSALWTYG